MIAQDRTLGSGATALPNFSDPQLIAQLGAALGQLSFHHLAGVQPHRLGPELFKRPVLFGILVIGQKADPLLGQFREKLRRESFPVEDDGKAHGLRISLECQLVELGCIGQQAWNDLLAQGRDQPGMNRLGDDEKGLPSQTVDPVIGGPAQEQLLSGDIQSGQGPRLPW